MNEKMKKIFFPYTSKQIKIIGFVVLCVFTLGNSVIKNGLMKYYLYDVDELSALITSNSKMMIYYQITSISTLVGGFCVPLFSFLLVEGYRNTKNFRKYLLSILALALISEIPYDLAMYHQPFYSESNNPVIGLFVALLLLKVFSYVESAPKGWKFLFEAFLTISAVSWVAVLNVDFGLGIVLAAVFYHLFYDRLVLKHVLVSLITVFYLAGPIAIYILFGYQNERGNIKNKYIYYLLYPAHLLLFAGITYMIG